MPLLEDVANRVAERTLKLIETTGDEDIEKKVADQIGASSPTLQEAFSTALRILKAEARASRFIDQLDGTAPPPKPDSEPVPDVEPEAKAEPEQEMLEHTIILGDGANEVEDAVEDEVMALPSPKMTPKRVS